MDSITQQLAAILQKLVGRGFQVPVHIAVVGVNGSPLAGSFTGHGFEPSEEHTVDDFLLCLSTSCSSTAPAATPLGSSSNAPIRTNTRSTEQHARSGESCKDPADPRAAKLWLRGGRPIS